MKNKGSIFYLVLSILAILVAVASIVIDMSIGEANATQLVYRSEVAVHVAEAVSEEFFHNTEILMNCKECDAVKGVYSLLRQELSEGKDIPIEDELLYTHLIPNSVAMCQAITNCDVAVIARVKDVSEININPKIEAEGGKKLHKPGIIVDKREKDAVLEIAITVEYEEYKKTLLVTKSLKVINTTVQPLSMFTMFVNDPNFPYMANWAASQGFAYHKDSNKNDKEQTSILLDHGWEEALGSNGYSKKSLREGMEQHLMQAMVPPGRIFINSGIVPLTNGNIESGMLQNAFFSAETELLPPKSMVSLNEGTAAAIVSMAGENISDEEKKILSDSFPESGEIHTRYIGHGAELRSDVTVNGKKRKGFGDYFQTYINEDEWATDTNKKNPSKSGLDLFGRVQLTKEARQREDDETGIFGKLLKVKDYLLDQFVNDNYHVNVSPTFVYGKVLMSYFKVMDYKYTRKGAFEKVLEAREKRTNADSGWFDSLWGDIKDVFGKAVSLFKIGVLGPGQYPIPDLPLSMLDEYQGDEEYKSWTDADKSKFQNQLGWPEDAWLNFMDLPASMRKPAFFKYMAKMRKTQQVFFGKDLAKEVPAGAILAPYNLAIGNFFKADNYIDGDRTKPSLLLSLMTDQEKGIPSIGLKEGESGGSVFLDNPQDQELDLKWSGEYKSIFKGILDPKVPLKSINPFLYYRKATHYVSSIYDFRKGGNEKEKHNVLKAKYFDEASKTLEMNGVIYIVGTANPLRFSEFRGDMETLKYKGKCIIISFGDVIIDVGLNKDLPKQDLLKPDFSENSSLMTIIALGGIKIETNQLIQASLYSFMYPLKSTHMFRVHGMIGGASLDLNYLKRGGTVKYDPSFYISDTGAKSEHYYWTALTDEIKKYSWKVDLLGEGVESEN
ncbi:MAG: hypothetical protein KC646_14635 [Candidatus Cloacimonetes bacterium]|nr:hypothetical protein [Candidatus Cloacimonadota bacterium]